jgi:hypothetical protein
MRVEPFNHLLRVLGEVVVAIPAADGAFDPVMCSSRTSFEDESEVSRPRGE